MIKQENVKDHPGWIRDERGMLINVNSTAYKNYMERKRVAAQKDNEIESLKSEINILNDKLNQIISLLQGKV